MYEHGMIAPVVALIVWSLLMLIWLYATRIPAMGKAKLRPYTAIPDTLAPALRTAGMSAEAIEKVLVENPAKAFAVRVRRAKG